MTYAQRICFIFFLQPIALGAWLPHIPGVQTNLGLSNSELAIALIGAPIGTLSTLLIAGKVANWLGARLITMIFYPAFLICMMSPFIAVTQWTLMAVLVLVGCTLSLVELGLNVLADEYEKQTGKKVMSKAHGFWSFGLLAGTLIGSAVAWAGLSPLNAGLAIAIVVQVIAYPIIKGLPIVENTTEAEETAKGGFRLPHPILLGVCLFTFGTTLIEGAMADWAAVYLRDTFAANPGLAGLGVSVFALCVASTRLIGDRLRQLATPGQLGQGLALIGLIGVALIWFAPNAMVALLGLGTLGIGVALAFPLGVTAASAAPGKSPASNVAVLSFLALLGFLVGPLTIGPVADLYDIRTGLMVTGPMLLVSFIMATFLTRAERSEAEMPQAGTETPA